jgi:hypothetical protein
MDKKKYRVWLPLLAIVFVGQGHAHHAVTAHFDRNAGIEIRGAIVDFKLRSPHSSFVVDGTAYIDGVPQSDTIERWEVEADSLPGMRRAGIDQNTFQSGDSIRIIAWQNRDPDFRFVFGRTFIRADEAVFGGEIGVADLSLSTTSRLREVVGIQRIVGRWRSLGYLNRDESPLPLNEAGLAAWRSYNSRLSPASTCESQSIPGVFSAPYIFELQMNDREVVLHNEAYSVIRTIEMDSEASLVNPSGTFGVATARVDGNSLIVESRDYPPSGWGLGIATHLNGGGADVPSSNQKTVVERYSVSGDGQTLYLDYTLTDPVYMTEPYNGRFELMRVADDTPIYPYECDAESAAMFSRQRGDEPLKIGDE